MPALLEIDGLSAGYGEIRALWDVSLVVEHGSLTLVSGPNGAGKTTLLAAVAGLLPLRSGAVRLGGEDLSRVPAHARVARGLAMVQDGKRVFRRRTVEENLRLGGYHLGRADYRRAYDLAFDRFPMLRQFERKPAGSLSGGQQQMLAIAQALMPGPTVLMLDEPSAGLAPVITDAVFAVLAQLRADGLGVLLVEQLVDRALPLADRVVGLNHGEVVMDETQPEPEGVA